MRIPDLCGEVRSDGRVYLETEYLKRNPT